MSLKQSSRTRWSWRQASILKIWWRIKGQQVELSNLSTIQVRRPYSCLTLLILDWQELFNQDMVIIRDLGGKRFMTEVDRRSYELTTKDIAFVKHIPFQIFQMQTGGQESSLTAWGRWHIILSPGYYKGWRPSQRYIMNFNLPEKMWLQHLFLTYNFYPYGSSKVRKETSLRLLHHMLKGEHLTFPKVIFEAMV